MSIPLRQFTSHPICQRRVACGWCRLTTAKGAAWREAISQAFEVPGGVIDFACPNLVPWSDTEPKAPQPQRRARRGLMPGPGDVAKTVIARVYKQHQVSTCDCGKIQQWMNDRGWLWCLRHKNQVTDRIIENAKQHNIVVDAATFWQAHRELRRNARKGLNHGGL